ncbi:endonuclease/exonuclease/phosphatase family protein [Pseudooceanicola sp.]|uniref:endonuclease/exonuclease/phosphatase family protein n=1 Tax=Pseudooceanicola sp. TaxID=1914328 RepID=UPI002603CE9F|nr:endonuclease/exonuclease/phosphatase family protein [Pseudooceanicola sp.]MDF1857207.1 endonuclease/exonuclease/phosphatase family protein [Pseudooceanicola sp.]
MLRDILRATPQVAAVRRVIDLATADVLLLAGMDFDHDGLALTALSEGLARPYPHRLPLLGNAGLATGLDLDGDDRRGGAGDRQSYGRFAGQDGMAILSRLPIDTAAAWHLNDLLWRDIPDSHLVDAGGQKGAAAVGAAVVRLSSGGHWAVPILLPDGARLTLLGFHAAPPVFDGPEDRNGWRNHDEIRLWQQLLDDALPRPAPRGAFVLAGAANNDPVAGEGRHVAIRGLLADPRLQDPRPASAAGGAANVDWPKPGPGRLRVDYLLPAARLKVLGAGVIWPRDTDPEAATVATASRHRLIWVDLEF